MLNKIMSLFKAPEPAGATEVIRRFTATDRPIDPAGWDDDAWRIAASAPLTVRLYEVAEPGAEQCMLAYRARVRAENVVKRAYLEMWCRLPGGGEFFSKGLSQPIAGTTGWASHEIPFYLKASQRPDLIKLNLVFESAGTVWMKDIELLKTPLK